MPCNKFLSKKIKCRVYYVVNNDINFQTVIKKTCLYVVYTYLVQLDFNFKSLNITSIHSPYKLLRNCYRDRELNTIQCMVFIFILKLILKNL